MTISTSPIIKGLLKIELYKFHFTRRYYGNHHYFLFLCLLRCFNSTGYSYSFQSFPKIKKQFHFQNVDLN